MRSARHNPNRLRNYLETHETHLSNFFDRDLVCANGLVWEAQAGAIRLYGDIGCRGNIVLTIEKDLEIIESNGPESLVQNVAYSYNASVRGHHNFLRYDNAHPHAGHGTHDHRHEYDWRTGKQVPGSPTCTNGDWPTLGEFIEEVGRWYWDHRDELPEPEACPVLNLRNSVP